MNIKIDIIDDAITIDMYGKIMQILIEDLIAENEVKTKINTIIQNQLLHISSVNNFSLICYVEDNELIIMKSLLSKKELLRKYIHVRTKVLCIRITKRNLFLLGIIAIENPHEFKLGRAVLKIGKIEVKNLKLISFKKLKSKLQFIRALKIVMFQTENVEFSTSINNSFEVDVEYQEDHFFKSKLTMRNKKIDKHPKFYYIPITCAYTAQNAIHIRRNYKGNLVLVKRKKQELEKTIKFRVLNSRVVSFLMYYIGYVINILRRKPLNIYYEKYASTAEEGAFDLFMLEKDSNTSHNYFVIEEKALDYEKIKNNNNVIKKNTFHSYFLIYCATTFIATEVPMHLNVLQSNNKYFRQACLRKKFVFLQHGITYLKSHGSNSTYCKDKEGEPSYIVTSSEKEMIAVNNLLSLEFNQMINVGLPVFSKIETNVLNNYSFDYATVMLTWKPYEENLLDYEESDYYKNTMEVISELKKYLPEENIVVVPHPKVRNRVLHTNLARYMNDEPVNVQLGKSKLLITDYSSVCYNTFYQGGGVIFYQPDLEIYEHANGKLIPSNTEYIGYRVFDKDQLSIVLNKGITNGKIELTYYRNEKFIKNYSSINEFSDGKNLQRLHEQLKNKRII